MNIIKRLLHLLPWVHFYAPWEDINSPDNIGHWIQFRRCTICNRGQRRWEGANGHR